MTTTTESRRERQRAATEAEIKAVARRQIVGSGGTELSLRGIARDMGMTAPGLYRYFDNLEALTAAMCHDMHDEVSAQIHAALAEVGPDVAVRLHAAVRAFRDWAVDHPAEFGLLFRSKGPDAIGSLDTTGAEGTGDSHTPSFALLFLDLFVAMWRDNPFTLPDDAHVPHAVVDQLQGLRRLMTADVPDGAVWVFAHAWVRLYSVIALEALGQLGFMFTDVEPYFEAELRAVVQGMGLEYLPRPS